MQRALIVALILLGALSRLVPHPWNASPLTAIALFGAAHLGRRWGLLVPLAAMILSDLFLGLHATIPFTWGGFLLVGLIGFWVRNHPSPVRILSASLLGSCVFFVVSNFGVWLIGDHLYPRTAQGFVDCFVAAIPFFRGTVIGDVGYTAVLFTLGYLLQGGRAPIEQEAGSA